MNQVSAFSPLRTAPETTFVVTEEAPVVIFPTMESWHAWLMQNPNAPRLRYCKYGCGGVGAFRKDVPVGHPLFGKAITCQCAKERTAEAQVARDRESLAPSEQTFTLDNWVGTDQDALKLARQASSQVWGLYIFHGGVGRAKSGLLAGIVNECLERKYHAVYKVATVMLDELRAAYESETFDAQMDDLLNVRVLALDEMWRFKPTEWAQEKIFQLLDYRYRYWDRLLTVVATNAAPDPNDALWSRFNDARRSKIVPVRGDDIRPYMEAQ